MLSTRSPRGRSGADPDDRFPDGGQTVTGIGGGAHDFEMTDDTSATDSL